MAIKYIQQNGNAYATGGSTSIPVSISNNPALGNTLLLFVRTGGGATTTSITDSAGNTWTKDYETTTGSTTKISIWRAYVTNAYSAGTVTANISASISNRGAQVYEFSGMLSYVSPLDQTSGNQSGTATTTVTMTNTSTTSTDYELVVTGMATSAATTITGVPSGYTQLDANASIALHTAYQTNAGKAAYGGTWSWSVSLNYATLIATYKPATSPLTLTNAG